MPHPFRAPHFEYLGGGLWSFYFWTGHCKELSCNRLDLEKNCYTQHVPRKHRKADNGLQQVCYTLQWVVSADPRCSWVYSEYNISSAFVTLLVYKRTAIFCVLTQRVVVISCRRFGTTYRPHFRGSRIQKHYSLSNNDAVLISFAVEASNHILLVHILQYVFIVLCVCVCLHP